MERYKARLVARGFQQNAGVDYFQTFSPVIKPLTLRIIFSLTATKGWNIQQIDINNAFLNGLLKETVYIHQPEGFVDQSKPHHVCRLVKALYGLKQAPKAWYDTLSSFLVQSGFVHSSSDHCLFHKISKGKMLLILVYVDDILVTGDDNAAISHIIATLNQKFSLKHLGEVNYFLGIEASVFSHDIMLSQSKYVKELLQRTNLTNYKSCPTPSCPSIKLSQNDSSSFDQPSLYRSIVGALQYLTLTRPDIAFSVNKLSQFLAHPTTNHWGACKRVLRYLKGTLYSGLHFIPVSNFQLQGFADADFASSLDDRRSTTGYCIMLGRNLLSWSSKKQSVVARSSTEAEYRSLAAATTDLVWISTLFSELQLPLIRPALLWCDNQGAITLAFNPAFHSRTKHIEVDVHYLREKVRNQELDVRYIATEDQPADVLTKPLSSSRFRTLCTHLGLFLKDSP